MTNVMKCAWPAGILLTLLVGVMPAWGADDPRVENLALCRDSWLDWKTTDPAKLDSFERLPSFRLLRTTATTRLSCRSRPWRSTG